MSRSKCWLTVALSALNVSFIRRGRSTGMSDMTLRAWSRKAYHPTASRLCVQILYVESLRSRVGLVRSVRTEEIFS